MKKQDGTLLWLALFVVGLLGGAVGGYAGGHDAGYADAQEECKVPAETIVHTCPCDCQPVCNCCTCAKRKPVANTTSMCDEDYDWSDIDKLWKYRETHPGERVPGYDPRQSK